jgi:hypothetical protein
LRPEKQGSALLVVWCDQRNARLENCPCETARTFVLGCPCENRIFANLQISKN